MSAQWFDAVSEVEKTWRGAGLKKRDQHYEALALLRDGPKTCAQISKATGLNENTVRKYMSHAARSQLVDSKYAEPTGIGHPRLIYFLTIEVAR